MIKITHFEVYTDRGSGWQLEDRFSLDQRQEAFNLAKELEQDKLKVKIIKEIFDVQDNSYQETVEYVSNLNKKKTVAVVPGQGNLSGYPQIHSAGGEEVEEIVISGGIPRHSVAGAVARLLAVILISLVLANVIVSLVFPVIENFISEDSAKPVLFSVFLVVFLSLAIPLVIKTVPWYVFSYNKNKPRQVAEKNFYDKAEDLIHLYNLNDEIEPIMTPAYPEAPLEYKQYVISFLTELLSNIQSHTSMSNNFSKLGVKLIVYGGCLELARYSGLSISEANSVLYEAFRIIDGERADLEAFYEAKRSYKDSKVAVFLTGVGAYLMAHVIKGQPMPSELLNITFGKWERLNRTEINDNTPTIMDELPVNQEVVKTVLVNIKSDLKFMDEAVPNKDKVAEQTSASIRNLISNLLGKYKGDNVLEAEGITRIRFRKINNALKFADECLKDIATYQEETNNENLLLRNCCAVTDYFEEGEPGVDAYLKDMFEHIYNGEIIATREVVEALPENSGFKFDFLGEKVFSSDGRSVALYKLID